MSAAARRPLPLRLRATLVATVLGLLLSLLAAGTAAWLAEDYEYLVATEILRGQADDYGLQLATGQRARLPRTQRLSGYHAGDPALPPAYAGFPPGVREDPAQPDIHVGVFDTAAGRLVFTIDLGDIEALERHLRAYMAAMVVLGTLLAGALGWWFSGLALAPLHRLAEAVDALPDQPTATALAQTASRDDLGRLARAIDAYQARLVAADAREQAFFADASHALRTPLAVIQGVTEVLLDDPGADPAMAARLQRLERGVAQMRALLESLLATARRQPLAAEPVDAAGFLAEVADAAGLPAAAVRIDGGGHWRLPRREARLLLTALLRQLQAAAPGQVLVLHAGPHRLRLAAAPEAGPAPAATADAGPGSALLERLAQRLGWQVLWQSPSAIVIDGIDATEAGMVGPPGLEPGTKGL